MPERRRSAMLKKVFGECQKSVDLSVISIVVFAQPLMLKFNGSIFV